jgi:O-antigen/teichoic acid export membrane protein
MLLVSSAFGVLGNLGLQSVASREMPALFARGLGRHALRLQVQVIGFTTLVALACAATLATTGLQRVGLSGSALALAVLHGWSQALFLLVAYERRSRLQMMHYAAGMAGRSIAVLLAGAAVALLQGSASAVIGAETVLSMLLSAAAMRNVLRRASLPSAFASRLALRDFARLPWRASALLLAGTLVLFVSMHLDRWIAAEALDASEFGAYSLAWIALVAAQAVQALLNSGLLPLLAQRRALGRDDDALRITAALSAGVLVVGGVSLWPAIWICDLAIHRWMPSYAAALPLLTPLSVAALLRVADFWGSLAIVRGQEGRLARCQACALALTCAVGAWIMTSDTPPSLPIAWLAVASAALSLIVSVVAATPPMMRGARARVSPSADAEAPAGGYGRR